MARADVLILCTGSRGDTEPWARLAAGLAAGGAPAALAAHPEYRSLAEHLTAPARGAPACVAVREIGGSLPRMLIDEPAGKELRAAKGLGALKVAQALMVPLAETWLDDALKAARELRPKVLVVTSLQYVANAWLIPEILRREAAADAAAAPGASAAGGEPAAAAAGAALGGGEYAPPAVPRLVIAHTVLANSTSAYAPATAGLGVTLPFGFLNRLVWSIGLRIASRHLYEPMTKAAYARYGIGDLPYKSWLDYDAAHHPPTFHVFSSTLVPPAHDWHPSLCVTGAIADAAACSTRLEAASAEEAEAEERLPEELRAFIAATKRAGKPVVYVGLGSMLGAYFDSPAAVLEMLAGGVQQAQARGARFAAVIHTVTGAKGEALAMPGAPEGADYFWLGAPVPHSALLPLVDVLVHHGGMGTTHAGVLAGRPAIIMPVSMASDQPFWADVLRRAGAGLASPRAAGDTSAGGFAKLLAQAVERLPQLGAAARELAARVRGEPNGLDAAVALVRRELSAAASAP